MSRTNPGRADSAMLTFDCEFCGEPAWTWCTTRSGSRWVTYLHGSRFIQATAEGLLPLDRDLDDDAVWRTDASKVCMVPACGCDGADHP